MMRNALEPTAPRGSSNASASPALRNSDADLRMPHADLRTSDAGLKPAVFGDPDHGLLPHTQRMPASVGSHPKLGSLYDRLALHMYAAGYAQQCVAALLTADEWAAVYRARAEREKGIERDTRALDPRELRRMLQTLQAGEMSVSRAIELLERWVAGTYSNDDVPPPPEDSALIADDSFPMELVRELRVALAAAQVGQAPQDDGARAAGERPRT